MNNVNYPQSSCPCSECGESKQYNFKAEPIDAQPSSLGVPACQKSLPLQYCTSKQVYGQSISPPFQKRKIEFSIPINKIGPVRDNKWYIPVKTNLSNQCKTSYAGFNPILMDPMRSQRLMLDQPHLTGQVAVGNVCKDQIYTKHFSEYGKNYTGYKDINGGDIQYWVSESSGDPYGEPVFSTPALVDREIFIDPMGRVLPQYNRLSTANYDWDPCNQDACNSDTHDALEFRQELTEAQQRKWNGQQWDLRWTQSITGNY